MIFDIVDEHQESERAKQKCKISAPSTRLYENELKNKQE
jgi:hypothetical protein